MKTFHHGTITELQLLYALTVEGTQIGGSRIFHHLFWGF